MTSDEHNENQIPETWTAEPAAEAPPIEPVMEYPQPQREEVLYVPVAYVEDTPDETMRRSGMAYSAGIAFVGSVLFFLFLGWGADLLLGTGPWGIVAGIVFGSILGFIQFFRITSRIFAKQDDTPKVSPLLDRHNENQD